MIKYKEVPWEFNSRAWSEAMAEVVKQGDDKALAELTSLSTSAIKNWAAGNWAEGFQHPNMTNFLKVCNVLDLSPHAFFTTGW